MSDDWWKSAPEAAPEAAPVAPAGDWWKSAPEAGTAPVERKPIDVAGTAKDVALSGAAGFARGTSELVMSPVTMPMLAASGAKALKDKVFGASDETPAPVEQPLIPIGLSDSTLKAARDPGVAVDAFRNWINGFLHKPETTAGKYASTVGEFLPGTLVGPGGVARGIATGVAGGLGSEAAGQATQGTAYEPAARIAGGIAGILAPSAAARVATPLPATAERTALAATLDAEGVPLTAGQRTGSKALQYAESVSADTPLGGGKAAAMQEEQRSAFTSAALKRAGIDAERATPEVMAGGRNRLNQQFDDLASRNTLVMDQPFAQNLGNVVENYFGLVPPSRRAPAVEKYVNDLMQVAESGGQIEGRAYSAMRSDLTKQAETLRMSDPATSDAFRGLRNALDENMTRSISPADAQAWGEARRQWGNLKDLEKAAGSAGEAAAQGSISPAQLRSAVASGNQKGGYVRGQGDFADLARAGVGVMSPLPQSGTAPRQAAQAWLNPASAVAGAYALGPVGALAGLFGPAMMSRAIMSRPVQAYLGNQAFSGAIAPNAMAASPLAPLFQRESPR